MEFTLKAFVFIEYCFILTYQISCYFNFHITLCLIIYLALFSTIQLFYNNYFFQLYKSAVFVVAYPPIFIFFEYNLVNLIYPLCIFVVDLLFWINWLSNKMPRSQEVEQQQITIIIDYVAFFNTETESCSICHETMKDKECREFPCKHLFHKDCIDKWLLQQRTCPLCRLIV
jgi:hypothetical protein